ncbi:Crp/Fnr family transcriptional regulator [Aquisalibacillus elongatus]|uniref:Transcriptional regulator n=1 Tax=Aquisalibacillus elongatus TaxID=485577 RepID=A0A3N5B7E2_9BACI|nr:Crp/Fnr family transcriptional regulator [Aquisalibacillus elongatus]RPF53227.1 transcriptional regulator [Aquisalibacillus elongatus]
MFQSESFFGQFPIFRDLSHDELQRLRNISLERDIDQGEILFHQNAPRHSVYFIRSGLVKIFKVSSEGDEQIINILHSDEMFPHVGFFDETPNPATAITLTEAKIVSVPIDEFELLLLEKPNMAIKVMKVIGEKLLDLQDRLQAIQSQDVFHRIVMMLIRFTNELGIKKSTGEIYLQLPITNAELASMIGVSRETVNRAFNRLKKENVMDYNRKEIHILDVEKLNQYWNQ